MPRDVVLATGGEWPAGLALLRGLRDGGYEPVAALSDPRALARHSRAARRRVLLPDALADPEGHAAALVRAAGRLGAVAVLPGTEASLVAVAAGRDAFGAGVAVGAPPTEVVARAVDKETLERRASAAGLRVPPTGELGADDPHPGPWPVIVKPAATVVADDQGERRHIRVARADGPTALRDALLALPGGRGVVQPYLPAPLRTVNGVVWEGEVLCTVHKRSTRTWPPDAGVFAAGATVAPDPALEAACARLLAHLGWSGIFNLQFLDTADGPLLIDVNPRAYHSMALALAAGANLPAVWCDALLGRPARTCTARAGVPFRAEEEDLRSIKASVAELGLGGTLGALRPRRGSAHAAFRADDPLPLLAVARALLG